MTSLFGRLLPLLLLTAVASSVQAQVETDEGFAFRLGGTVQPRVSFGADGGGEERERFGFGMRRARLISRVTWRDRFGVEVEIEASGSVVEPVDVFAAAYLSERVRVRAGRMWSAQPRGFNPTSHRAIDAVERAAIIGRWAGSTIGSSGRDMGVDLRYDAGPTSLELFVHDGSGIFTRDEANFRESIESSSVTRGTDRANVAVSGAVRHEPPGLAGVELGAFGSVNAGGNPRTAVDGVERSYATGAAFLYWGAEPGSQPVRLKLDALGIAYEAAGGVDAQAAAGVSGLGAVRVLGYGEAFARAERFWPDLGPAETYLTAGASYSPSAAAGGRYRTARLTAAYAWRDVAGENAHLVVLQGQFAF